MTDILTGPEEIHNSPHNNSPTKQLYSIAKARRFSKDRIDETPAFYTLPRLGSKRSTSFGHGKKFDFTKNKANIPAPGTYKDVDKVYRYGHLGTSFGLGRGDVSFLTFKPKTGVPGPGAYSLLQKVKRRVKRKKYDHLKAPGKLRKKRGAQSLEEVRRSRFPGPGHYDFVSTINEESRNVESKFRSCAAYSIHKLKKLPFAFKDDEIPGPGAYNQALVGKKNRGVLSTKPSPNSQSFTRSKRYKKVARKHLGPGPGHYRLPSEFGHYGHKVKSSSFVYRVSKTVSKRSSRRQSVKRKMSQSMVDKEKLSQTLPPAEQPKEAPPVEEKKEKPKPMIPLVKEEIVDVKEMKEVKETPNDIAKEVEGDKPAPNKE